MALDDDVSDFVEYEVDDPVAVIRLNRPERLNAFTLPMVDRLEHLVRQAESDSRVVGIVIAGSPPGFCAGFDADELVRLAGAGDAAQPKFVDGMFGFLLRASKPVVAAIGGVAAGGGFLLACCCDIRLATAGAQFTTAFAARGLTAEQGLSWLLPRLIGPARALDILSTSRRFDGLEAERIGLVQMIVEADVNSAAKAYVRSMAATSSPASLRDMKGAVYRHLDLSWADAIADADRLFREGLLGPDPAEGVAALRARRPPRFERLGAVQPVDVVDDDARLGRQ